MIRSNILCADFSDEYKCRSIMKTFDYGKDNLAVIHDVIENYDSYTRFHKLILKLILAIMILRKRLI